MLTSVDTYDVLIIHSLCSIDTGSDGDTYWLIDPAIEPPEQPWNRPFTTGEE